MLKHCCSVNVQRAPAFAVKVPVVDDCRPTLCGITIGTICSGEPAQRIANRLTAAVTPVLIGPWSFA